jgi:hypothetical protein
VKAVHAGVTTGGDVSRGPDFTWFNGRQMRIRNWIIRIHALLVGPAMLLYCTNAYAQPQSLDITSLAERTEHVVGIFDVRDAEFVDDRLYILNEKTSVVHVFDRSY